MGVIIYIHRGYSGDSDFSAHTGLSTSPPIHMEDIVLTVLRAIGAVFSALLTGPEAWWNRVRSPWDWTYLILMNLAWLIAGAVVSGLTLLWFKEVLVNAAGMRVALLVIAPVAAGWMVQALARYLIEADPDERDEDARRYFWHAFWCVAGFVLIRFLHAARS